MRAPTIGVPARQAWRMGLPQLTESPAQAIEGHFGPPQAPVGALAPMQQQLPTSEPQRGSQQGEQKSIGQGDQQEHFAPRLPALQSQRFDEQFAFLKTETFLDFPATDIGEDDVPGLLDGLDRFIGEQIPGFTPLALSHHHQPQLPLILWVVDRQGEHARAAIDATMCIPEQPRLSPGALAPRDLPGFALLARSVDELVAFLPAHHKAQLVAPEQPEPGSVAIATIKDVAHLAPPALGYLTQQDVLLLALLPRHTLVPTPPFHRHHLRHATLAQQQQAFPFKAAHTHRDATGLIEQAFAAACQPSHAAGAHRPQAFQFLAFRLFQHAAIPDAQWRFALLLHQLSALLDFLPQHLLDHLGLPALMV